RCDELQAALERGGPLIVVREQVRLGGLRAKAPLDLGVLAHDPFEDRETDREEEVDGDDAAENSEDDSLQQPHVIPHTPRRPSVTINTAPVTMISEPTRRRRILPSAK